MYFYQRFTVGRDSSKVEKVRQLEIITEQFWKEDRKPLPLWFPVEMDYSYFFWLPVSYHITENNIEDSVMLLFNPR